MTVDADRAEWRRTRVDDPLTEDLQSEGERPCVCVCVQIVTEVKILQNVTIQYNTIQ